MLMKMEGHSARVIVNGQVGWRITNNNKFGHTYIFVRHTKNGTCT